MPLSVPEGHGKVYKYPPMIAVVDVLIVTKTDYLPLNPDFDSAALHKQARAINPRLEIFKTCARTGEGNPKTCRMACWIQETTSDAYILSTQEPDSRPPHNPTMLDKDFAAFAKINGFDFGLEGIGNASFLDTQDALLGADADSFAWGSGGRACAGHHLHGRAARSHALLRPRGRRRQMRRVIGNLVSGAWHIAKFVFKTAFRWM